MYTQWSAFNGFHDQLQNVTIPIPLQKDDSNEYLQRSPSKSPRQNGVQYKNQRIDEHLINADNKIPPTSVSKQSEQKGISDYQFVLVNPHEFALKHQNSALNYSKSAILHNLTFNQKQTHTLPLEFNHQTSQKDGQQNSDPNNINCNNNGISAYSTTYNTNSNTYNNNNSNTQNNNSNTYNNNCNTYNNNSNTYNNNSNTYNNNYNNNITYNNNNNFLNSTQYQVERQKSPKSPTQNQFTFKEQKSKTLQHYQQEQETNCINFNSFDHHLSTNEKTPQLEVKNLKSENSYLSTMQTPESDVGSKMSTALNSPDLKLIGNSEFTQSCIGLENHGTNKAQPIFSQFYSPQRSHSIIGNQQSSLPDMSNQPQQYQTDLSQDIAEIIRQSKERMLALKQNSFTTPIRNNNVKTQLNSSFKPEQNVHQNYHLGARQELQSPQLYQNELNSKGNSQTLHVHKEMSDNLSSPISFKKSETNTFQMQQSPIFNNYTSNSSLIRQNGDSHMGQSKTQVEYKIQSPSEQFQTNSFSTPNRYASPQQQKTTNYQANYSHGVPIPNLLPIVTPMPIRYQSNDFYTPRDYGEEKYKQQEYNYYPNKSFISPTSLNTYQNSYEQSYTSPLNFSNNLSKTQPNQSTSKEYQFHFPQLGNNPTEFLPLKKDNTQVSSPHHSPKHLLSPQSSSSNSFNQSHTLKHHLSAGNLPTNSCTPKRSHSPKQLAVATFPYNNDFTSQQEEPKKCSQNISPLQFLRSEKQFTQGENSFNTKKEESFFRAINNKIYGSKDYRFIKKIGKGKHSEVFLAQDISSGFIFAVKKVNKKELVDQGMEEQFSSEIKIQMTLRHPNILGLYGYSHDYLFFYLYMEYAPNDELYRLQKSKPDYVFTEPEAAYYLSQLANALSYLHKNKIIHRDLKPENLLLSNGVLKLADFGYCRICDGKTLRRTFCGTLDYLSPKIVNGEEYNQEIDIWSYGVLAYEFVQGVVPFYEPSRKATMNKIKEGKYEFKKEISIGAKNFINSYLRKIEGNITLILRDVCLNPWIVSNVEIYQSEKGVIPLYELSSLV